MAARNKTKAEEAIANLKQEGLGPGNGEVVWLELDLVEPRNAKTTAQEFMSKEKRLDILSEPSNLSWMMHIVKVAPFQFIMLLRACLCWPKPRTG